MRYPDPFFSKSELINKQKYDGLFDIFTRAAESGSTNSGVEPGHSSAVAMTADLRRTFINQCTP